MTHKGWNNPNIQTVRRRSSIEKGWYFVNSRGESQGPYSLQNLAYLFQNGDIHLDTQVST